MGDDELDKTDEREIHKLRRHGKKISVPTRESQKMQVKAAVAAAFWAITEHTSQSTSNQDRLEMYPREDRQYIEAYL